MVFAVASVTDRFDGEIARRRGLVTDFGKIADPIADKALIGAALVGLSMLDELPWWVTVVDPGPRDRRHPAALLGHPARRDPGQPRRQGQDAAAGRRDRPVPAAAARRLAARRRRGRDGGRGRGDRGHRRRLRGAGRAAAPHQRARRDASGRRRP